MNSSNSLLDRPIIHAPDLADGEWLNTPRLLTREYLRGRVLLIDFWDYACVNCIRTLPYLKEWHGRYAEKGLTIIGVHAPEFKFGHDRRQVAAAAQEFGLEYPILIDNGFETWTRFANRAWPSKYLVDADGYIRLKRQGEGHYQEIEKGIQLLLRQRDPAVSLPELLPALREEDKEGAVCYRPTPELHAGYQAGLFGGALGNVEGYTPGHPMIYQLPPADERQEGRFYAAGIWLAKPESLDFAGQEGGRIVLPYRAVGVNAVLSPSSDPVELMLNLRPGPVAGMGGWGDFDSPKPVWPAVTVQQDGRPLAALNAGADVVFDADGRSLVQVTRPRLVELARNPAYEAHELELLFHTHGLALYAFTFTTCLVESQL